MPMRMFSIVPGYSGQLDKHILNLQNALQVQTCQTGVVVEILCGEVGRTGASAPTNLLVLEMPRLPYVKYSTGANETTRTAYRALGKPDWTAARRAFLAGRTIGEWYAETKCFFRRVSAIPRSRRLFSPYSFLARQKRMGCRRHNAPFRRRKDMARGAAATALQTAARLRRIRNDLLEAERLYTQTA